jgi:hypothetical protein
MKKLITSILLTSALALTSNAAVSLGFKTHNGSSNGPDGLPVVDSAGAAILNSTNSVFASIGYLTTESGTTAQNVLSRFVPLDSTPLAPNLVSGSTPRNGLISGNDFSDAGSLLPTNYVSNFQGKNVFVLIGNNSSILTSTAVAMFSFASTFAAPDVAGNLSQSFTVFAATTPTIGNKIAVTSQPIAGNTFVNGVSLVSVAPIPETSTSLLGAIGALALLRRRRN